MSAIPTFVSGFFEWFDSHGGRHMEVVRRDPREAVPVDEAVLERAVKAVEDGLAKSCHSITAAERARLTIEFYALFAKERSCPGG